MIKIRIGKSQGLIENIEVWGHAGYRDPGEDVICASISALTFTLIESMDGVVRLSKDQYTYKINPKKPLMALEIKNSKLDEDKILMAQTLAQAFVLGAEKSSEAYKDFVEINIQEV